MTEYRAVGRAEGLAIVLLSVSWGCVMKFLTTVIAIVILIGATAALAQQPGMPGAHQPPAASAAKAGEAMPMEMCQAMMGGGMMGPSAMDGAHMAQMME